MEFDGDHSDSTENMECPLCMEEIDVTDKYFKPCPCGYQICRFCWNHIKEDLNGKCPACRRDYTEEQVEFRAVSAEELAQIKNAKKIRDRERKEMDNAARRHLANVRVVQKNLIYVVGMPSRFATEEHLKSNEFFGQFGKISRVVISRKGHGHTSVVSSMSPMGVFIFYVKKDDAIRAIEAVDGTIFDGNKVLRVTHGTTKYCQFFLKNQACQHTVCQYLHEPAEEADTFAKDELSRQALRDRNPRPAPFSTLLTFYKKGVAEENPLPASARWAKPVGSQRTLSSPVTPVSYNHLTSAPHPSDSEYSDSDSGRPMRSNLMDLIAERKKSKKPASSLAKETAPSPQSVASPPSTNAQRELQQVEPIPPGLFPAKISDEPSTNTSLAHEKSAPSHPASNFPDENQILGSKALNDGNDEPVPNLIRRGPPNSAYAIARKRAMESLARKGMDPKKGGVSMYNMGFILQPTYNGLFDPFTNDPMALIRGVFLEDGNSGPKSGKADAVEDPSRGMHQNATPQNGVQDDGRWFENTINKTPLPEFPVIASQQWAQQQMLREQQQLTRDQGLSESVLRQQQLARNSQFINVNVSANARQHEFLLLQQQQQQQRFQQQQQQYLGGTSHDEFPSAFTQEAQVRESQNQLRDLQVRERNAELLNSSVGSLGLKNASVGGWGGASAVGDYANDRWVWNAWSENSGAIWTDGYATAGGDSATRTGTNDEWYRADSGFMGARANAPSTTAAAAVGSSVPIIANAGGRSSGGGTAESVPELAHSRGNGSESLKADTGSVIEVTEIEGRKEIKPENGRQTMTNDGGKVDGKDATISSKGKTVVGYDPVVKKPKDVQTVTSITPQETAKEILSVAATTPPVAMTRKEKAKQRAKERELARQLQSERDLLAIREKEEAERKRLEVIVNDKDAKDDTVLSQQSASQSSQLAPETPIPTKSKKARQKSKKKQTSEINAKTEASISAHERESTAEEPLKSNVENSVAETIPEDGTSKKYSRRKRAKERDEKAKLLVPLESESHATNSSSSAAVENAMLPSASKAETIADLVKTPLYTSLMANMTEFSSKINQALRGEVDLESMVNGPFGQFLLGQADASNNPDPSTIDFSSPTEMTAGSISNALLAIADSFLKCAEASASQLASDAPLDGHLEFDESLQDVNAVDAAERFEADEEASENADETLQVAGIDSYANILEKSVSIDMVRAPPVSNSSSKYINPFPMRHPNASDIEEDDEDNLCIEDGSSGFDYDFANLEEDAWESEPGLDTCDADFEYGEKEESEDDVDLQTVDPDRSIAFLNQGAAYISELLESVHWMVEKGQNLIDSPPNVSPAVIELMATLEAENPWEPGKPVVPRRLPCQDLVDMLEQELEKCEEIRNGVERQLLDVIETNRNNAPELIEHFGLDPHVLEDICKIPGGVTASHSLPATVKFV